MDSPVVPSLLVENATFRDVAFKAVLKGNLFQPVPNDNIESKDGSENDESFSSTYMMVFLPVAAVLVLIGLAAVVKWRYRASHAPSTDEKRCAEANNHHIAESEGDRRTGADEKVATNKRDNDSAAMCESFGRKLDKMPEFLTIECELLKESTKDNLPKQKLSDKTANAVTVAEEKNSETTVPRRPMTLHVKPVAGGSKVTTNGNSSEGFQCAEHFDGEVVSGDTYKPEGQDCVVPLMAKGKFKMKPKGLLERRGSNVALTISLKNEEKASGSPPPSSMSPKPLHYLRTATAKLDPVQLHIKSADTSRLQQEFWEVPMNHPSEKHFTIPGYGTKNRYRSILPNPHSRVLLPAASDCEPLSAYINANYIRGYSETKGLSENGKENEDRTSGKGKASYIATQGPMANTIVDFWKMVWQEKSAAIVMITKLKERKEKCSEYMPTVVGEKQAYEEFEVEVTEVRNADHYSVRRIEVRNCGEEGEVRTLTHYWYAEWLDHETPDKLRGLLTLVQEVELECPGSTSTDRGPVVVHCSAGIGRTGCFIAISNGCQQLRSEGKVDPLRIICQLRMDRGGMIQTWEQYQYVHVALSRYARLLAGDNCNTPLTGSSTRTPDSSRSSSRHTTPVSGGSEFKSPQSTSRLLFSPRLYTKPDLTTVAEDGAADNNPAAKLSLGPTSAPDKSKFSFSCAENLNRTSDSASDIIAAGDVAAGDDITMHGAKMPRNAFKASRTESFVPSHRLALKLTPKLSPVRDENWLMSGLCAPDGEDLATAELCARGNGFPSVSDGSESDEPHFKSKGSGSIKEFIEVNSLPCGQHCRSTKSGDLASIERYAQSNGLAGVSDEGRSQNSYCKSNVNNISDVSIEMARETCTQSSSLSPENGDNSTTFDLDDKDLDKLKSVMSIGAKDHRMTQKLEQK